VPLALARTCGFTRRARCLTADVFCQSLVFGWLAQPDGSLEHLARTGAVAGAPVSAQAWHQRFGPAAAELLRGVLEAAVQQVVSGQSVPLPVLARFAAVLLVDSTTVALPAALAHLWRGCGGGHQVSDGAAALKVSVAYDLRGGRLWGLALAAGRTHDRAAAPPLDVPPGSLLIRDRGYFALAALRGWNALGVHYLTRPQSNVTVFCAGQSWTFARLLGRRARGAPLDMEVALGTDEHLPLRLLAWRVPPAVCRQRRAALRKAAKKKVQPLSDHALAMAAWQVLVTDLPPQRLSAAEAHTLYRARWQIELLFKVWKSEGGLARSRSRQPQRVLCEVYAKLLAVLLAHWFLLTAGLWADPRRSLCKAFQHLKRLALALLMAFAEPARFGACLAGLAGQLRCGCRTNTRRKQPNTWQLLAAAGAETLS
jgi:hypothetical protein